MRSLNNSVQMTATLARYGCAEFVLENRSMRDRAVPWKICSSPTAHAQRLWLLSVHGNFKAFVCTSRLMLRIPSRESLVCSEAHMLLFVGAGTPAPASSCASHPPVSIACMQICCTCIKCAMYLCWTDNPCTVELLWRVTSHAPGVQIGRQRMPPGSERCQLDAVTVAACSCSPTL